MNRRFHLKHPLFDKRQTLVGVLVLTSRHQQDLPQCLEDSQSCIYHAFPIDEASVWAAWSMDGYMGIDIDKMLLYVVFNSHNDGLLQD